MSKSKWSSATLLIAPPRPDQQVTEERKKLRERIIANGLKETFEEILDEYYNLEDELDPIEARRKKRATLIFSKKELKNLISREIYILLGGFDFLGTPWD